MPSKGIQHFFLASKALSQARIEISDTNERPDKQANTQALGGRIWQWPRRVELENSDRSAGISFVKHCPVELQANAKAHVTKTVPRRPKQSFMSKRLPTH